MFVSADPSSQLYRGQQQLLLLRQSIEITAIGLLERMLLLISHPQKEMLLHYPGTRVFVPPTLHMPQTQLHSSTCACVPNTGSVAFPCVSMSQAQDPIYHYPKSSDHEERQLREAKKELCWHMNVCEHTLTHLNNSQKAIN